MAKPGSNDARRIAAGGVDLSVKAMSDEKAAETQIALEYMQGLRCSGCGLRIGLGIRLYSIDPRDENAPIVRRCACAREECDFADFARGGATYMEMVDLVWLDAAGMDAPAYAPAVERYQAMKRAAAADSN